MRGVALFVCLCLWSAASEAEAPPPVSPEAWLPTPQPSDDVRVQRRFAVKAGQLRLDAGGEWLARGDYYVSPGVQTTLAWWWREQWAAELSGGWYFSGMNAAARDLRARTGRVPDSHRPQGVVRLGLRHSAGYGKLLFGSRVIHLEPQLFARLSLLVAEAYPSPGLDVGGGLLVHVLPWLHVRLDVAAFPHLERRTRWTFVTGVVPSLSVGVGAAP